jgi:hypothetical protein
MRTLVESNFRHAIKKKYHRTCFCIKKKNLQGTNCKNHITGAATETITKVIKTKTYIAPATVFPRKKHKPILTPTSGPRARPMR